MKKLIHKCCILSELVYMDRETVKNRLNGEFSGFKWINNDDTDCQVLICRENDRVFVVFRGTEHNNWDDWKTNLDCDLVPGPYGMAHEGFLKSVLSVWMELQAELIKDSIAGRDIVITGHSKGASEALVFAMTRLCFGMKVEHCVPVAMPRCLNFQAAIALGNLYGKKLHYLVNNNDIVTRMPPRMLGYKHIFNANLYYFDEDGECHHDLSRWERFKDRISGYMGDFGESGVDFLKDHKISEYVRLTEKW